MVSTQSTQYRNSRTEVETLLCCRAPSGGALPSEEVREFCVWRNAPMRVLSSQGELVDSYDPALKEHRTVCFLAFDGHCYMYRAVTQAFAYEGGMVWDFVQARRLLRMAPTVPSMMRSWALSTAWWPRPGASWTRRRATLRR